jgi:hypothetical protein
MPRLSNTEVKALCESLILANHEQEVISLLRQAGLWDDPDAWRFYDDNENNFSTIGNQQSRPDAALVEKLINAIDARLIGECRARGVDPEGGRAPRSMRAAVARYFGDKDTPHRADPGLVRSWTDEWRRAMARHITLAATGNTSHEGNPCFTITDAGEGQTPEMMPETFLSLTRSNKLRIPFVQGKFNMGSTGVLEFCGRYKLQLIVSRRDPRIVAKEGRAHPSDDQWGFTVVRREDPRGNTKNPVYTFLAPLHEGTPSSTKGVLRFSADGLKIFPTGNHAYAREGRWGTLIKLYEYESTGRRSHILRSHGLLERLDLLLPEAALPIRLHECRLLGGHKGSFDTTLTGLAVRLDEGKGENLEPGFPSSSALTVQGMKVTARIYAFKRGKADTYRRGEGVLFTVNGQTHGIIPAAFFRQKRVGLDYLADSLLVLCDCDGLDGRARVDLFMNSRDRLRDGPLKKDVERELEEVLKNHGGLLQLLERRRQEELASRLDDARPLAEILESLLKRSPTLARIFLPGLRVPSPTESVKARPSREKSFVGRQFPTFFRHKGKPYGSRPTQRCSLNARCRVAFETDALNDYFRRDDQPGEYRLFRVIGDGRTPVEASSLTLHNGVATLSLRLPADSQLGDRIEYLLEVSDPSRTEPFQNGFFVAVQSAATKSGGGGKGQPPPSQNGDGREIPAGIQLPNIIRVPKEDWGKHTPTFDEGTALRVKHAGSAMAEGRRRDVYDFYVNVDNASLLADVRSGRVERSVVESRFIYGMVLLGMGLLQQEGREAVGEGQAGEEKGVPAIEDAIERFTRAVSPVLLPMIESLGSLDITTVGGVVAEEFA